MDEEDRVVKAKVGFPRPLETLSVEELDRYVGLLEAEILRVKEEKIRKQAMKEAAAAFFKS